jgi:hydrogenase maturation protease
VARIWKELLLQRTHGAELTGQRESREALMSKARGRNAQAGKVDPVAPLPRGRASPARRIDPPGLARAGPGAHLLIAGIGNSSFGDDGFGVEVLHRLQSELRARPHLLPDGLRLFDCGSRALQLAHELTEPLERVLLINAIARGGRPGSLYLLDLDTDKAPLELAPPLPPEACAGALDLEASFATARSLAARRLPAVQLLGCEPAVLSGTKLSPPLRAVLGDAVEIVRRWLQQVSLSA